MKTLFIVTITSPLSFLPRCSPLDLITTAPLHCSRLCRCSLASATAHVSLLLARLCLLLARLRLLLARLSWYVSRRTSTAARVAPPPLLASRLRRCSRRASTAAHSPPLAARSPPLLTSRVAPPPLLAPLPYLSIFFSWFGFIPRMIRGRLRACWDYIEMLRWIFNFF